MNSWRTVSFQITFIAVGSVFSVMAQTPASSTKLESVVTMRDEYSIVPAGPKDDGQHYKLNRLAKDKSVYETFDLVKTGEKDGATIYSSAKGTLIQSRDGSLVESVELHSLQMPAKASQQPLTLMKQTPVVPIAQSQNLTKLGSFTPPEGTSAGVRTILEGQHVVVLVTEITDGQRHEVAVKEVGKRLGETFFIRVSNQTSLSDAPVYGLVDFRTVNSYSELPQDLQATTSAQTSQQPTSDSHKAVRLPTGTVNPPVNVETAQKIPRQGYEPPVEKRNPDGSKLLSADGKRQFTLTLHQYGGVESLIPVTPVSTQAEMERPTSFYREVPYRERRLTVYSLMPPELGETLNISDYYPDRDTSTAPIPVLPSSRATDLTKGSPYHVEKYPVHADRDNSNRFSYHLGLPGDQKMLIVPRLPTDLFSKVKQVPMGLGGAIYQAIGGQFPQAYLPNFDYAQMLKDGNRYRDWMIRDNQGNTTYVQLKPEYRLQKGKDGPWTINISSEPYTLYNPKDH